jgi:Domain of unknown function (DUF1905).
MKFKTTIFLDGNNTGVEVPAEVVEQLGGGKRAAVELTVGKLTYRSTIASMGGKFLIPLSAARRAEAGVKGGDEVEVEIALDTARAKWMSRTILRKHWRRNRRPRRFSKHCPIATSFGTYCRLPMPSPMRPDKGGSPRLSKPWLPARNSLSYTDSPRKRVISCAAAAPARLAPIVDAEGPYPTRCTRGSFATCVASRPVMTIPPVSSRNCSGAR